MQIGRGVHHTIRVHQVEFLLLGLRKKIFVALILEEAKYMAAIQATCEAI